MRPLKSTQQYNNMEKLIENPTNRKIKNYVNENNALFKIKKQR